MRFPATIRRIPLLSPTNVPVPTRLLQSQLPSLIPNFLHRPCLADTQQSDLRRGLATRFPATTRRIPLLSRTNVPVPTRLPRRQPGQRRHLRPEQLEQRLDSRLRRCFPRKTTMSERRTQKPPLAHARCMGSSHCMVFGVLYPLVYGVPVILFGSFCSSSTFICFRQPALPKLRLGLSFPWVAVPARVTPLGSLARYIPKGRVAVVLVLEEDDEH